MKHSTSRRDFLGSTTRAGMAWSLYPGAAWSKPLQHDAASEGPLDRRNIEAEVRRRAEQRVTQRRLEVDYYRLRRSLAYPLPLESLLMPTVPVPTITGYPWATWLLWELEERVNSLGWAAEWFREEKYASHAARDLEALSVWPKYCQMAEPSLESAHAGRILWAAWTKWHWLSEPLREKIRTACGRHVQEVVPHAEAYFGSFASKQDLLGRPAPHEKLGNVAVIRTVGAALAAHAAADPVAARLDETIRAIFGAILDLRAGGHAEGVGYDGYVLDFIADWLTVVPADARREILEHPRFNDYLDESALLGAPGAAEQVAQLSDVEPREMPFHFSAQAKLASLQPHPVRAWLLRRWPPEWVRADALGALRPIADDLKPAPPAAGAANAHYAVVLRSGGEKEDLAVAMSCSNSPMGHIQNDNGTLVIGTRRRWLICDPGYQQYMRDAERDFTVGPAAHNCPVINGAAQDRKQPRLLRLEKTAEEARAQIELAACYPAAAGVRSAVRSVWQVGTAGVVVCDQIAAESLQKVTYHWHGHPDAAWWSSDGWMLVHLPDLDLWFTSPQVRLSDQNIDRLPGSRGQLTLAATVELPQAPVWWVFALSPQIPQLEPSPCGQELQFLGKRFAL
jgi:hypothetical protein